MLHYKYFNLVFALFRKLSNIIFCDDQRFLFILGLAVDKGWINKCNEVSLQFWLYLKLS